VAIQTSLSKKVTGFQDCNHYFLALHGNDSEFDLALLDVKDGVRRLPLRENDLIVPIGGYRSSEGRFGCTTT